MFGLETNKRWDLPIYLVTSKQSHLLFNKFILCTSEKKQYVLYNIDNKW